MVVEGVYSTRSALALGEKYQVCLPIIEQVYEVIFLREKNVQLAVTELMDRIRRPRWKLGLLVKKLLG